MMIRKVTGASRTLIGGALAVALLVGGCRREPPAIAVIPRTTATLFWEPMHLGIAETARASDFRVYWNAPAAPDEIEKQIGLYLSVLKHGYRGIIFAPDDTLASRSVVLQTVNDGIPVVIVDDQLGPAAGPLLSYVSNDEAAGAMLAAERVAILLHGNGNIAVMGFDPGSEESLTREDDFESAITQVAPGIHIAVRQFGDLVVIHQQEVAQHILNRRPRVDAIVALSSAATRGAYYAKLADPLRSGVFIVGFDQGLLLPLRTGAVDSVVAQNTFQIGRVAMTNLLGEMRGEHVRPTTLVPPILLTRDNMDSPSVAMYTQFPVFPWQEM